MKRRRIQGKYAPKYPTYWEHISPVVGLVFTATVCATLLYAKPKVADTVVHAEMAGEASTSAGQTMPSPVPSPTPSPQVDLMSIYISEAVNEFLPNHKSESLMIMHCLAHRENGHAANRKCGDSGNACGPFQFWEATWNRMRKQMIEADLAEEIGDRYDQRESARTTAWAIANGRGMEWGPILRNAKGVDYATCQKPSWYK